MVLNGNIVLTFYLRGLAYNIPVFAQKLKIRPHLNIKAPTIIFYLNLPLNKEECLQRFRDKNSAYRTLLNISLTLHFSIPMKIYHLMLNY